MARALTAPELTKLRRDNQRARLFLAVHKPNTVLSAQVNGDPASDDQIASVSIDGVSWGSGYTSAPADLLVYVGSSAGVYNKGMVRLREALSGTPSTLKFGEISEIDWADDDYITVVDEFAICPRHLRISGGTVYMDYDVAYSDQHATHDPVPVLGPPAVVDESDFNTDSGVNPIGDGSALMGALLLGEGPVSEIASVNFDASESWVGGGGISSYNWATQGDAISGENTATPTVKLTAAGIYRVECTLTASNGKTYTGYRYIYAYTSSSGPTDQFTLDNCSGALDRGGWSYRVTLYADAARTDIRDRAQVILFARDFYGADEASIGPVADRENVICVGWIDGESITWDAETGAVSFDVQGPQFWLGKMPGFPSGLEDVSTSPTAWTEMQVMTLKRALWHFVHWRTTLTRLLDVKITSDNRRFSLFNARPGMLWQQIASEAQSVLLAKPAFDRYGRLFVYVDQPLLPTGDRGGIPTIHDLQAQDLRRPVEIRRSIVAAVSMVDLSGIDYDGDISTAAPLFALAPGHIPKLLGGIEKIDRLALTDQSQANTLTALYLAWRNNEYPNVQLPLASNHRALDIVPHQRVTLSLTTSDTVRGVVWSTEVLVPRAVAFKYEPRSGVLLTDLVAEVETDDTDVVATTGDIPAVPPSPAPPPSRPPAWNPTPTDPDLGTGEVIAVAGVGGFCWTDKMLSESSPTWSAFNTGLSDSSVIVALCNGPLRPYYAACIDNSGAVFVSTYWRGKEDWRSSLTEALADALITAAEGEAVEQISIVDVQSFAESDDETGTLLAVVQYVITSSGDGATRVLRNSSINWSSGNWVCGGEIPGETGTEFSWDYGKKGTDDAVGELTHDGTHLVFGGQTPNAFGATARSGLQWSGDWGATWQSEAVLGVDSLTNPTGPACVRAKSTGVVVITWWQTDSGANGHDIVSGQQPFSSLTTLENLTDGDVYGNRRGMLAIIESDERVILDWQTGDTKTYVYLDGDKTGLDYVGYACRHVHGFELDDDVVYIARSYIAGEQAGVGDESIIELTENKFVALADRTGNLYTLGMRGVTGIVTDWSAD